MIEEISKMKPVIIGDEWLVKIHKPYGQIEFELFMEDEVRSRIYDCTRGSYILNGHGDQFPEEVMDEIYKRYDIQ